MRDSPVETPALRHAVLLAAAVVLPLRLAAGADEQREIHVFRGNHQRVQFDADFQRSAVGDPDIVGLTELDPRQILVLGKDYGHTSILVWLQDGRVEELHVSVERDISLLQRALSDIHPDITAEMAPDRDAIVLRGVVPSLAYKIAAEDAARRYLDAGGTGNGGKPPAAVQVGAAPAAGGAQAQPGAAPAPLVEAPPRQVASGTVIDLIRLADLPLRPEDKIRAALESLAVTDVQVSRLSAGDVPDPSRDVFVLEGHVPDQTTLIRAVTLAARIVGGEGAAEDIQVVADEAGSLPTTNTEAAGGGGSTLLGGTSTSIGFGGSSTAQSLRNRIESNLGRAKVLQAAAGRVISFIEVTDLPQVRIDIRLLEVNRTRLQSYGSDLAVIAGDFPPGTLSPANAATVVQGSAAKPTGTGGGSSDVQNVLAFLDGTFTNELQITASRWAIDSTLSMLQSEGLARSLSQPSLTVLSGELAVVKVGGEIPVENTFTPAFGGTAAAGTFTTVIQEDFGVSLAVRPLIGDDGMVTLDMIPEVTRPDFDLTNAVKTATGNNLPTVAKQKRSLRTTARLDDGQTLLVGGLITKDEDDTSSYTPWLHDIPILGTLFEGFATTGDDVELVIVVHPVVVRQPCWQVAMWAFPSTDEMLDATVPPKPPPPPPEQAPATEEAPGTEPAPATNNAPATEQAPAKQDAPGPKGTSGELSAGQRH